MSLGMRYWPTVSHSMVANANTVVRWLKTTELGDSALIDHAQLNEMLDPVRSTGPLRLMCSGDRCRTTLAYWALASQDARVIPAPARRTTTDSLQGTYSAEESEWRVREKPLVASGEYDLLYPGLDHEGRYPQYVEWALRDDTNIHVEANPGIGSGYPLRFRFTCPRCEADDPYTNKRMLIEYLRALTLGQRAIRPGRLR